MARKRHSLRRNDPACNGGDGLVPYQPHLQLAFRIADPHEFPDDRTVHVKELSEGRLEFLLRVGHAWPSVAEQATLYGAHDVVHGEWRQDWAHSERFERPALGRLLGTFRWEGVPPDEMPDGHAYCNLTYVTGSVGLVRSDATTHRLRNDMNDVLLRAAGDGLWNHHWPIGRPPATGTRPTPLLTPAATASLLL